jgi:predicted transcriptional regulator
MPPAVLKALKKVGLSDKEVTVVLALLQGGPMLAAQLAKAAKLNRTTTYGLLKGLAEQGLVSSIHKKGEATRYQAIAPEMLPGFIERRRDELAESKKDLEEVVPQIMLLRSKGKTLPKVQYFEGMRGVEQAYMEMVDHNKEKHIYAFTGLEGVASNMDSKFVDFFINSRMKIGIDAYYVVPKTEIAYQGTLDDHKKMRYVRFIPPQFDFNGEIDMWDNKVGIFSYAKENPVALIIEDETIAHAMKQIFAYVESTTAEGKSRGIIAETSDKTQP